MLTFYWKLLLTAMKLQFSLIKQWFHIFGSLTSDFISKSVLSEIPDTHPAMLKFSGYFKVIPRNIAFNFDPKTSILIITIFKLENLNRAEHPPPSFLQYYNQTKSFLPTVSAHESWRLPKDTFFLGRKLTNFIWIDIQSVMSMDRLFVVLMYDLFSRHWVPMPAYVRTSAPRLFVNRTLYAKKPLTDLYF